MQCTNAFYIQSPRLQSVVCIYVSEILVARLPILISLDVNRRRFRHYVGPGFSGEGQDFLVILLR